MKEKEVLICIGCVVVGLVVGKLLSTDSLFCQAKGLNDSVEYVKFRLNNLNYSDSDISQYTYVKDAINSDRSVKELVNTCNIFPNICDDIIEYELKRVCYDIN